MNMETLWDQTCELLKQEMSSIAYITWVNGNLTPVQIDGDRLIVRVTMTSMMPTVMKRSGTINRCLSEAAGRPMTAALMTGEEIDEMFSQAGEDDVNDPNLNPKYTFENFVVGSSNRFANAAALAVAETPADAYNPLFIYGGVGLGKTHLMQAIGHYIHQEDPSKRILYMTSESFTNELITAIQQKKTYDFRARIRKADVLMVDDIQFIAGRESTQQEFFNTFNELHNANKQIILTSDKHPKEIQRLEERLCSRFEWGLVADIQRPDIDTRVAILRRKAEMENIAVPDDVLELIAGKVDSNVRELEGCLKKIMVFADVEKTPVTTEICERALRDIFDQKVPKQVTADLIMRTVSDYYGLTLAELTGPTRRREVTMPRQVAIYLTRELTGMSLPQIGTVFGGRDHTTILHSYKTVDARLKANKSVNAVVEDIKRLVKEAQ